MSKQAVLVEGLGKSFGSSKVVSEVSLAIGAGEIVALLGPSGCGKTTTLRCLAGLEHPDEGRITIGGRVVFDAASRVALPPEKRNVGMMFQSYAVWPHMTIFENVAYGLRIQGLPASEIRSRVEAGLRDVGLADKASRFPATLSGGEQQRVALARSMMTQPGVLLMDEPLSNLDLKLRERMRLELRDVLKRLGVTAVYVTHDQADAMVLADRLVIMSAGRVIEMGEPRQVYERPKSQFASEFLGTANVVDFAAVEADGDRHYGRLPDGRRLELADEPGGLRHIVRPERIQLVAPGASGSDGAGENVLEGEVAQSVYMGNLTYHTVRTGELALLVQTTGAGPRVGERVHAWLPRAALVCVAPT
ncbi:MAG TPA: ABC transporter ATP-binding protein [Usitatibacter sp.]|nr:ABC transporter ATP-binding protein [Usitatibacter sp.]